jgi:hypothetical protein
MIKNANKNAIVREEFLEVSIFWYNMFLGRKFICLLSVLIDWCISMWIYSVVINALYIFT